MAGVLINNRFITFEILNQLDMGGLFAIVPRIQAESARFITQ
jgi:hypothetical protein